jgi:DeoR family transcriptional regulator, glycerol-3-phosphate regulon repressor
MNMSESSIDDLNERQAALLALVRGRGYATVEWLAEHFAVSAQTVRRDIIRLDERGMLQRFHGGAGAADASVVRLGYAEKQELAVEATLAIGTAAARLVPNGASVFVDVGTTAEAVARALAGHTSLRVFTNSLAAARQLADRDGIEVVVAGGLLRGHDGSLVGDSVTATLRDLRLDLAFIGLSGWDDDGAPMDFDIDKIAVKRIAIARAREAIAICDASKFVRQALARIAPAEQFARLICDASPSASLAGRLDAAGVAIMVGCAF